MLVQELTRDECRKILGKADFGRLACARDNQPYIVPIHFVVDGDDVYSFAMAGQKIQWMRDNPLVCLEIDQIQAWNEWTVVAVFGEYEELSDTAEHQLDRLRAHELLKSRAMWWLPASAARVRNEEGRDYTPIFYRINILRLTGRRGVPAVDETAAVPLAASKGPG